jgi:tRNA (cytidine56-2'-O)-methyltransferase
LTARALGAEGVIIADVIDRDLERTIRDVVDRFGGPFFLEMGTPWREVMKSWKDRDGEVIHLTAYGLPLPSVIAEIRSSPKDKLVVVGSEKVPSELFSIATWNVAITNQPMSEVAALAVFLDRLLEGAEFQKEFKDARMIIVPSKSGKRLEIRRG